MSPDWLERLEVEDLPTAPQAHAARHAEAANRWSGWPLMLSMDLQQNIEASICRAQMERSACWAGPPRCVHVPSLARGAGTGATAMNVNSHRQDSAVPLPLLCACACACSLPAVGVANLHLWPFSSLLHPSPLHLFSAYLLGAGSCRLTAFARTPVQLAAIHC